MASKKSIVKNYVYNLLYQFLTIILPIVTTPYVSRILGADGLGAYSYTFSIATYFCIFGRMGLDVYGQLAIAECRDDPNTVSNRFWGIFLARTALSLIAGAGYLVLVFVSHKYRALYAVLSLCLVAQFLDISWLYQGMEEFKKIALRNSAVKLIGVALIFGFVRNKEDLILYTALMQIGLLAGNLSLWLGLKKYVPKFSLSGVQPIRELISSLPYFIPTIATSIYTILDKSMIGWITNSEFECGYYEQAHKIELILVTVVTSLSMVTLPRLKYMFSAQNHSDAKKLIHSTTGFILAIACPMTVGLMVTAPKLIPWFLGAGYEKCVPLLQIFSLLILIIGLNNLVGKQVLMASGRQKFYNYGVVTGACVNVILNLLLISSWMSIGAAIASVASEFVILIVFLWFGRDYISLKVWKLPVLKYMTASIIMGACVYVTGIFISNPTICLVLQVLVGILSYALILLLLKDPLVSQVKQKLVNRFQK